MIALIRNEAGLNAISKINNMLSDHKSSLGWNMEIGLKKTYGFDIDVMMLTSGSWEVTDPKCGQTRIPPELLPAAQEWEKKFL